MLFKVSAFDSINKYLKILFCIGFFISLWFMYNEIIKFKNNLLNG